MSKKEELKNKDNEELVKILREKQLQLLELRLGSSAMKVKDSSAPNKIRKEVAKILTIINSR